jgi:hypothetical protein
LVLLFETLLEGVEEHCVDFIVDEVGVDEGSEELCSDHELLVGVGLVVGELRAEEGDVAGKLLLILLFVRVFESFHSFHCLFDGDFLFVDSVDFPLGFSFDFIGNLVGRELWEIITTFFEDSF